MFNTVITISFHCLIALQASVIVVKVLILSCIHDLHEHISPTMQGSTRIIGSIHSTDISSANGFIVRVVDLNFYELIEGIL